MTVAAETQETISDLNVMVAGQAGDGSLTVVTLLSRLLAHRGFHMYTARDVRSRIKGGHAAALLRGSTTPRGCIGDHIDLLVAFDEEAIEAAGRRMAPEGIVIFDASAGPVPFGHLPETTEVFAVPFARMAVRDLRRDLYKNSLGFGLIARILGVDDEEAVRCMRERFRRLPEALLEANVRAMEEGFSYADANGICSGNGQRVLDRVDREEQILISGNEALALGFLAAGGRFFAGYPITPASEILDWLERNLPKFGGVTLQAEDELAAVNMGIGAAMAGARAMTATSGPGLTLMQEGVSHLGSAEIPLVVVDCQRSGPSTGMPTKPEQSDISMVVHGGNGDFPRIVLAPGDPTDCFELSVAATNLSQRLQCPVYLMLDQMVAQDSATVKPFDFSSVSVEPGKRLSADDVARMSEYRRYQITEDGVSSWALPGTPGGMHLVTGNERNEWGLVSTEPGNRAMMLEKRMRKVSGIRRQLPAGRIWGDPDTAVGLLGVGMELGPMQEASELLADAGLGVTCLQPRTLWPVPDETLQFIRGLERVYVVEHNIDGQLAQLLASVGAQSDRLRGVLKYDGVPFAPRELASLVLEFEEGER